MVEIGYKDGKRTLANDARWRLTASKGEVKVVVTISINQKRRDIILEKWGCDAVPVEPKVIHGIQMQQEEGQDQYLWWPPVGNQLWEAFCLTCESESDCP